MCKIKAGFRAHYKMGGLQMKYDVNAEVTLYVECKREQEEELQIIIKDYFLDSGEYTLDIIGCNINSNNETEFYIIMNTKGSYEDNLEKFNHLHMSMGYLLEGTSIKYKGISLIPNQVKWN